jgi:hypothetical protein
VTVEPEDGSLSFGFDAHAAEHEIDATLEELLALPGRIAAQRDRRVAIVLDEFQEIVEIDPGLIKLMRSVFQEQPEVAHVYLGSKRHMMSAIFNDDNEPFWRSARQMELGRIAVDDFRTYASERFAATGKSLPDALGAAALNITSGHPYATQELLYFLWEQTPAGAEAGELALARALDGTLRSEHAHFSLLWERAATAQRRVLQALAAEQPGRPLSTSYRERHGLPSAATVQTAVQALMRDELVSREGRGAYAIAEPFLTEWITLQES